MLYVYYACFMWCYKHVVNKCSVYVNYYSIYLIILNFKYYQQVTNKDTGTNMDLLISQIGLFIQLTAPKEKGMLHFIL